MISQEVKDIALRLVAEGMSKKQTARVCGVSLSALKSWLDPTFAERRRQSRERSMENNAALFCERLERERREAAKARATAAGGAEIFHQT